MVHSPFYLLISRSLYIYIYIYICIYIYVLCCVVLCCVVLCACACACTYACVPASTLMKLDIFIVIYPRLSHVIISRIFIMCEVLVPTRIQQKDAKIKKRRQSRGSDCCQGSNNYRDRSGYKDIKGSTVATALLLVGFLKVQIRWNVCEIVPTANICEFHRVWFRLI